MLLATWLYSFYIAWVSSDERNFNILYGGLSSIVLLLIWFYVLSFVLIIGVQLNAAWIEVSDERLTKKKVKLRERYHVKRNKQIAADKSEDDELPLVFGTAGMRGLMGEGKNRFNVMTVRRASQAFATHILEKAKDEGVTPSIVIAYDSRRDSDLFAYEAASVFAANEVKAYVFRSLSATPLLSFAVREIGATAGLVITASHNGKEYNGYKIYNSTGCQCLPDEAADVAGIIDEVDPASGIKTIADSYRGDASQRLIFATDHEEFLSIVPDYIESKYFDAVISTSQGNEGIENLSVVYTPLNGVGNLPVREVLKRLGVVNIALVNEQELPDSEFTTCPEPNPENPEALALGLSLCEKKKLEGNPPDLLIATDPDSDRLGVAAYHDGAYTILTGNQVGVLMLDYLIEKHKASGLPKGKPVVITSIVSTPLAAQIADSNGVEMQRVLTGFKNIGAAMNKLDSEGRISDFIFSYEESCGYLSGTYARDKDAINAAMLTCEIAALYKTQGKTFVDRIHEIEDIYGYVAEETVQFVHPGEQGMRNMEEMMRLARSQKVRESLGADLLEIKDYLDEEGELRSDVVEFDFSNHSKVLLRPSGTEPKVKAYFFTFGDTILEATTTLNDLKSTFIPCIEV
jgi:phosphoglucomutase